MSIRTNRHSVYDLEYHLVVATNSHSPVLTGDIRDRLIEISHSVIESNYGCIILEIEVLPDYVHILFEAPPHVQLSKLVNSYKTVSSRLLRKEFGDLLMEQSPFWSYSYLICINSEKSIDTVEQYIAMYAENDPAGL